MIQLAAPRIYLAEDDPDLRHLLTAVLEDDGYSVASLENGHALLAGLEAAIDQGRTLAAVISDHRMPGMVGLGALERMRARGFAAPMILITAFADPALKAAARNARVHLVEKPFEIDDLRTIVRMLAPTASHVNG